MRRARRLPLPRVAALALFALSPVIAATSAAAQDVPTNVPPTGLVAHEWGVWVLERGRVAHLDELAAELPAFVPRPPQVRPVPPRPPPPRPPGPPVIHPPPVVARKPVLYLTSTQSMAVHVEVGFTGGEPWLVYPTATRTPGHGRSTGLVWDGRIEPRLLPVLDVPRDHFWKDLRAASTTTFVGNDGSAERFLFYDGPVAFERSFRVEWQGTGAAVVPTSTERTLFLVTGGRFTETELDAATRAAQGVTEGDMTLLRSRLDTALRARGLTGPEARALLETWRDSLFTAPTTRAIYFVPRDAYDRMLPLRITPTPDQLVRVGLVIERL